ncbi:MAG: antibiotic biosynthesis monooxygenase [Hyphomonadaceae bacterium]
MAFVLIVHQVDDYVAWKAVFDGAAHIRKAAGEISFQVLTSETDANRVIHFSRWRSLEDARLFFESAALVEIRREAGVHAPEFTYLNERDHGILQVNKRNSRIRS